jgi:hypothetical protein
MKLFEIVTTVYKVPISDCCRRKEKKRHVAEWIRETPKPHKSRPTVYLKEYVLSVIFKFYSSLNGVQQNKKNHN